MRIKANKLVATGMATALSLGMIVPALAASPTTVSVTESGKAGTAEAVLTAEGAVFDVTVPMQLPIAVNAKGVVSTSKEAKIINGSCGAVKVTNVAFNPNTAEGWSSVAFLKDMSAVKVGTKEVGFTLNGCETDEGGGLVFLAEKFPAIAATNAKPENTDELLLVYDARLPAQKTAIVDAKVADVVFTIGWDEVIVAPPAPPAPPAA